MLGLLAKNMGMTQLYNERGELIAVTALKAGPCKVTQKKTKAKDGYDAVQLGFEEVAKLSKVAKPLQGHCKKAGVPAFRYLREFRDVEDSNVGQDVKVDIFKNGDFVDVSGTTKGRGFQGVIKRCGSSGGPAAHGSKFHRAPGSIGMRTWPGRVLPGTSMPGHLGNAGRTVKNLEVTAVDAENNILFVKGSVPGSRNGLVVVRKVKGKSMP